MGITLAVLADIINSTSVCFQNWGKDARCMVAGAVDGLVFPSFIVLYNVNVMHASNWIRS
jgi:hypothetical protein